MSKINLDQNSNLDKAIIGHLVLFPETFLSLMTEYSEIKSKHFYNSKNGLIWDYLKSNQEELKIPTQSEIAKHAKISVTELSEYLVYASIISNPRQASQELIRNFKQREISKLINQYDKLEDPNIETLVDSIKLIEQDSEVKNFDEIFSTPEKTLIDFMSQKEGEKFNYCPPTFENIKLGLPKASLIVIGARAKVGKTTLALQMAKGLSYETKVAFFSLEMTKVAVTAKFLALPTKTTSGVNPTLISEPPKFAKDSLAQHQSQATSEFLEYPVHFAHCRITVEQIIKSIREAKNQGFGVFVIDQLSKIKFDDYKKTTKQKYDEIVDKLSIASKELQVCIILLSQCNRNINAREDKRPEDSDISDTDRILQEADLLFVGANVDKEKTRTSWLIVNRNGRGGIMTLAWNDRLAIHDLNNIVSNSK